MVKAAETHESRPEKPPEEIALIQRARTGDADAFADLCEQYRRRVWRVVASVTGNRGADTEDLAQEAILRAYRSLPTFRGEASFEAWLCRIALNAAHDYQKSAWKRRVLFWGHGSADSDDENPVAALAERTGNNSGDNDPHETAARRDLQRRVRAAVAGLGNKERVPIWLIYFEEFSLAEVARLESVPESTIRSRVKVGLKRLGRVLGDLEFSEALGENEENDSQADRRSCPQTRAAVAATPARVDWKGVRI